MDTYYLHFYMSLNLFVFVYLSIHLSYLFVSVTCAKRDLHSGVFGGSVHEGMTDLIHLMSRLVAVDGKILVPGIYHDVKAITDEERMAYQGLDFDCHEYAQV